MTTLPTDLPIKLFRTEAAWETWLAAHGDAPGVWLKIAKKDTGATSVSYSQALDVALPWLDRWPETQLRRAVLPSAVHAAQGEEFVVEAQHRARGEAGRCGTDAGGRRA